MGECIDINWQIVDNTLSERMIDNSLIHLLDRVQKKISKKTAIVNAKLKELHIIKNYEHFVNIKTKISKKLNNCQNENEISNIEISSDEMTINDINDSEENVKENKQNSHHKNESDSLQKEQSNNLVPMNDVDPQLIINDESNESVTDGNSTEDSKYSHNNDDLNKSYSDMISDDEDNELENDDSLTKDSINSYDNDITENHSDVISDHEKNKLETDDNLTKDSINRRNDDMENQSDMAIDNNLTENSINSHNNDNTMENHINIPQLHNKDTQRQKDRPNLKIIMTEIVKPKYTVIQNPLTTINTTKQYIHNQKLPDELSGDNESIELECSQRNHSPIRKSNKNDTNNKDSINSAMSGNAIMIKKRVIKNKNQKNKMKNIIVSNENQKSQSNLNKIADHINNSDSHLETLNNTMIEDEVTNNDSNIVMNGTHFGGKTDKISSINNKKLQSSLSNEQAALAYTLQHMAYHKHRQEKLNHESQFLNENYINIENESRKDSILEQENDLSQPNVLSKRPTTLDEFFRGNGLVPLDDKISVLTLDDLSEDDDLFLMEIPKSVINGELLGQKMVVRNFDMTIGTTNYKLHRQKNDILTCILKENNERMSFKAVNIKPKGTFVVKQIISPSTEDMYFHQTFDITSSRCPFPKNLKIRNPSENKNKRLKKYKKKIRNEKKKIKI